MTQKILMHALGMTAALAVATPVAATAQGRFNGLDRNRDGVVTRAEWRGNDQSFRNQDRNRDGVLSGAELNRGSSTIVPVWSGHDTNRDGRITRDEWPGVGGDFDVLDRNDDGWLSRTEVNSARNGSRKPVRQLEQGKPAKQVKQGKQVKQVKPVKQVKQKQKSGGGGKKGRG